MAQFKYSLIIPHYNIPDLLKRLLTTVPNRKDLQVIVVDDCSNKDTNLLDELKKEYDWVEWYSTGTNGGGGKARNIGLSKAKGDYILFADADDFFFPNLDDLLNKTFSQDSFDILFFNVTSLDSETFLPSNRGHHLHQMFLYAESDLDKAKLHLRYLFGEPWCKIIKRDLIEKYNIKFDETKIHNDTYFSYIVGHYAKEIILNPIAYYCLTTRDGSVSLKKNNENILIRQQIFAKKQRFLQDNKIELTDMLFISPYLQSSHDKILRNQILGIADKYGFSEKYMQHLARKYRVSFYKKRIRKITNKISKLFLK